MVWFLDRRAINQDRGNKRVSSTSWCLSQGRGAEQAASGPGLPLWGGRQLEHLVRGAGSGRWAPPHTLGTWTTLLDGERHHSLTHAGVAAVRSLAFSIVATHAVTRQWLTANTSVMHDGVYIKSTQSLAVTAQPATHSLAAVCVRARRVTLPHAIRQWHLLFWICSAPVAVQRRLPGVDRVPEQAEQEQGWLYFLLLSKVTAVVMSTQIIVHIDMKHK